MEQNQKWQNANGSFLRLPAWTKMSTSFCRFKEMCNQTFTFPEKVSSRTWNPMFIDSGAMGMTHMLCFGMHDRGVLWTNWSLKILWIGCELGFLGKWPNFFVLNMQLSMAIQSQFWRAKGIKLCTTRLSAPNTKLFDMPNRQNVHETHMPSCFVRATDKGSFK